ncbi:MAG: glucose-6-phosphate dehydrogenase [Candidatus Glassbacteria bacterium]
MSCEEDKAVFDEKEGQARASSIMVIFGASGDLTKRKLVPALYNLARSDLLSDRFAVVGIARSKMSSEEFRQKLSRDIREFGSHPVDPDLWDPLVHRFYYMSGNVRQDETYVRLRELLSDIDKRHQTGGNYFFYLATAPDFFSDIIHRVGSAGLAREENGHWRRVIIEKPFGRDLKSARALNRGIRRILHEDQIYRIDHYLGKETVQNILVFRFANGIFEPTWNRRYIDHIQITVAEDIGVGQRGGYYEGAGALRDMVPNHIFQLITLMAMEPPISFEADAVRDEQVKILRAIQIHSPEDVSRCIVRGQYGEGKVGDEKVPAYRSEPHVAPDSVTETFVALKMNIDNWRWADVPFYVRTGKRLPRRVTELGIQFKRVPFVLFRQTPVEHLKPNRLVIRIQPDEGISLSFGAKIPGPVVRLGTVDMDFRYKDYFGSTPSTGYERLLHDCMMGDATLFQREDMVEASWSVVAPILEACGQIKPPKFPNYPAGTWGPPEADELMAKDGRGWWTCD